MSTPLTVRDSSFSRAQVVGDLRHLLQRVESLARPRRGSLPFGLPALDSCLPQGGLLFGALHEFIPAESGDTPAALGLIAALLGRLPIGPPLIFVATPDDAAGFLHGHGLSVLGLDPARLMLIQTTDEKQTRWAMEEALRSAVPAAVAGALGRLDLKTSQRLHLTAEKSGALLLLLRPPGVTETNAATTRWRIRAAAAARDRFGLIARFRWHATLERCRNGRTGEWLVEFDHAAHAFSLGSALADPALSLCTEELSRAG